MNKKEIIHRVQELDEMIMLNKRRLPYKMDENKKPIIEMCIEFEKEREELELKYFELK
jgi:hypothetical protein